MRAVVKWRFRCYDSLTFFSQMTSSYVGRAAVVDVDVFTSMELIWNKRPNEINNKKLSARREQNFKTGHFTPWIVQERLQVIKQYGMHWYQRMDPPYLCCLPTARAAVLACSTLARSVQLARKGQTWIMPRKWRITEGCRRKPYTQVTKTIRNRVKKHKS